MIQRKFICVQSSAEPLDRLNYNEQSQYIAATTKSTRYDRLKKSIIETLKEI
jgi:hypothetical protein